jgi:hypothetical protein
VKTFPNWLKLHTINCGYIPDLRLVASAVDAAWGRHILIISLSPVSQRPRDHIFTDSCSQHTTDTQQQLTADSRAAKEKKKHKSNNNNNNNNNNRHRETDRVFIIFCWIIYYIPYYIYVKQPVCLLLTASRYMPQKYTKIILQKCIGAYNVLAFSSSFF